MSVPAHDASRPSALPASLRATVLSFAVVAAAASPSTFGGQLAHYGVALTTSAAPALLVGLLVAAVRRNPDSPWTAAGTLARARASQVGAGLVGFVLLMASYTTLKTNIPNVVPFYADAYFIAADRALFGGRDAWTISSALPQAIQEALHALYAVPWFAYWILTVVFALAMPPGALRTTYLWAFTLKIVLLGVVAATAWSSVGPVLHDRVYEAPTFAGLTASMQAMDGLGSLLSADYLYRHYAAGTAGPGTGISAFPSIHCASVFLNALFWMRMNRLAGIAASVFAALIFVGSVATGWHYAVDGLASLAGVAMIWFVLTNRSRLVAATAAPRGPAGAVA